MSKHATYVPHSLTTDDFWIRPAGTCGAAQPRVWLRLLAVVCLALATSRGSWAAPVGPNQARKAAEGWLKLDGKPLAAALGGKVARVDSFADAQGQAIYYAIHLDPSGFLIVPADDQVEPIVAFVEGDTYDLSPSNPLRALVEADLSGRIAAVHWAATRHRQVPAGPKAKWNQLLKVAAGLQTLASSGLTTISDLRVSPLTQSMWNQGSEYGDYCYNYYTPDHDLTGCVATAFAQVLRYYQYPTAGIGVHGFTIYVEGTARTASTRGGDGLGSPYSWSQMPLIASSSMTIAQRQAIGALCYDTGVSVSMSYTANASSASTATCKTALVNTFGYSNAIRSAYGSYSGAPLNGMLNPNLDASYVCLLAVSDGTSGHSIVADGYGYNLATLYHHLNLGWGGSNTAWYNLPSVNTSYYGFSAVTACVYNIYVIGSGEIVSGRTLDSAGNPIAGVTVTAQRTGGGVYTAVSSANGIYALAKIPSNSTYAMTAAKTDYTFASQMATTGMSSDSGSSSGNVAGLDLVGTIARIPGDIDGDGYVNVGDLQLLAAAWGSHGGTPPSGNWNAAADLNNDGYVNVGDLQILVANWGRSVN
jgi:hypothetical protein